MEKLCISRPIIVEGKYDKIKLDSLLSAHVIPTDGFALFKKKEKAALLRRLAEEKGVIVLTDADGGGKQIRAFLSEILPKEKVIHLYIPAVAGKEKRKTQPGKAGLLGVEGIDADTLRGIFAPFADGAPQKARGGITKQDLYADGLSGGTDARKKREALSLALGFPPDMTANALLDACNLLYTKEEYREALRRIAL
ncbi:MAG: DUF4093 domain-containing protein [Ruminococcaceae bacterium]|nr:DUF4093 domain-containing protein [Oscillospiraceae bacterium]